jgi:hypothetical protein
MNPVAPVTKYDMSGDYSEVTAPAGLAMRMPAHNQFCTESYDRTIAGLWSGFDDPMVYTPGDNEWTDCHKKKEGGGAYNAVTGQIDYVKDGQGNLVDYAGGNPVANLALVRSIFFPQPGATLGSGSLHSLSQATAYDPAHT